jgi:hypothetical protein
METIRSSETSVLTRVKLRNFQDDGILHSYRRENLKSYITLAGWAVQSEDLMLPVKYELGFYISKDGIHHSHRRENLKPYIPVTAFSNIPPPIILNDCVSSTYLLVQPIRTYFDSDISVHSASVTFRLTASHHVLMSRPC